MNASGDDKQDAYVNGWDAYFNGKSLEQNPYGVSEDELREEWAWGWKDASRTNDEYE